MNDSEYFERFPNKETLEIILERTMENKGAKIALKKTFAGMYEKSGTVLSDEEQDEAVENYLGFVKCVNLMHYEIQEQKKNGTFVKHQKTKSRNKTKYKPYRIDDKEM